MGTRAAARTRNSSPKGFTGWHMTGTLVAFFAVVIGVNVYMATNAVGTFGGVVVENSYVASQHFNRWLEADKAQAALGWKVAAVRRPDGYVAVTAEGPAAGALLSGEARHPLGRMPDRQLAFNPDGKGGYLSRTPLDAGRWTLRLQLTSGTDTWRGEMPVS